ncbi:MAG: fibronectin type III domain-containing protein, partial [Chthoniobacterales bacterium]|nr:fibronectin type III domain-containing protein [Chthoniobacterales bacterium]
MVIISRIGGCIRIVFFLLLSCGICEAESVTIQWAQNPEQDIASYRLYYGVTSGNYTNQIDVLTTTATASGLAIDTKYFFAVTAFDTDGLESQKSTEIAYTVPTPTPTPTPT